jgi:hypothetical protein
MATDHVRRETASWAIHFDFQAIAGRMENRPRSHFGSGIKTPVIPNPVDEGALFPATE